MAGHVINTPLLFSNVTYGGNYRITGALTRLGVVGRYRVRCYHRKTGFLLRETWSSVTGAYVIDNLRYESNGYTVIAFDHLGTPLNAAIADLVTPEPMP